MNSVQCDLATVAHNQSHRMNHRMGRGLQAGMAFPSRVKVIQATQTDYRLTVLPHHHFPLFTYRHSVMDASKLCSCVHCDDSECEQGVHAALWRQGKASRGSVREKNVATQTSISSPCPLTLIGLQTCWDGSKMAVTSKLHRACTSGGGLQMSKSPAMVSMRPSLGGTPPSSCFTAPPHVSCWVSVDGLLLAK